MELRLTGRDGIARALYVTAIGRRKFPGIYADPLMVTMHHFMFEIEGCVDEHDAGDDPGSGRARKMQSSMFLMLGYRYDYFRALSRLDSHLARPSAHGVIADQREVVPGHWAGRGTWSGGIAMRSSTAMRAFPYEKRQYPRKRPGEVAPG